MTNPIAASIIAILVAVHLSALFILICWIHDRRSHSEPILPVGTKSLLFGVHQFVWHPYTVWRAWRHLYGAPTWRQLTCIIIHDWGYWGSPEMDGEIGSKHPLRSAKIAMRLGLDLEDYNEILLHSRHLAFNMGREPSQLCWADKYSMLYDPNWFYLIRARLSGEIREYRANANRAGFIEISATDLQWLVKLKEYLAHLALKAGKPLTLFTLLFSLFVLGQTVPVLAGERAGDDVAMLAGIADVENWQGRRGPAGEIGPWQMMPSTWAMYRGTARERAEQHLAKIRADLRRCRAADVPWNIALCWNAGVDRALGGRALLRHYDYALRVKARVEAAH